MEFNICRRKYVWHKQNHPLHITYTHNPFLPFSPTHVHKYRNKQFLFRHCIVAAWFSIETLIVSVKQQQSNFREYQQRKSRQNMPLYESVVVQILNTICLATQKPASQKVYRSTEKYTDQVTGRLQAQCTFTKQRLNRMGLFSSNKQREGVRKQGRGWTS